MLEIRGFKTFGKGGISFRQLHVVWTTQHQVKTVQAQCGPQFPEPGSLLFRYSQSVGETIPGVRGLGLIASLEK